MTSIKWNGQEVTDPALRSIVATFAICLGLLAIPLALAGMVLAIILLPITLPLDLLLKRLGRRGFITNDNGQLSYAIGHNAFRRA
jgi:hypothetical protein